MYSVTEEFNISQGLQISPLLDPVLVVPATPFPHFSFSATFLTVTILFLFSEQVRPIYDG